MADTSARMLRLLSLLQLHRYWPGNELAERLEVSERTVRRDIDRLRSLGYPVESLSGATGGYQMGAGSSLPPMVFEHDEAIALAVGLRDVAHGSDVSAAEASLRALAKLTAMLPPSVRNQIEVMSSVTESNPLARSFQSTDVGVLGTLAQACRDSVRMRFQYTAADGMTSQRYVEPYRLVTIGRRWYLVAFDIDRNDWRTFRVDRTHEPVPLRNSFEVRQLPAGDLVGYIKARIRDLRPMIEVEFIVTASLERVMTALGKWATVSEGPRPDTCHVRLSSESFEWPMIALATLDADFAVISPPEFIDHLARFGTRLAKSSASAE
jgi:predicted DNA-binding transcriptional regulator YafY